MPAGKYWINRHTPQEKQKRERDRQKQSEETEILNRPKDEMKAGEVEVAENGEKKTKKKQNKKTNRKAP